MLAGYVGLRNEMPPQGLPRCGNERGQALAGVCLVRGGPLFLCGTLASWQRDSQAKVAPPVWKLASFDPLVGISIKESWKSWPVRPQGR